MSQPTSLFSRISAVDLVAKQTEQRDQTELLYLAGYFVSYSRCCGKHLVASGYQCGCGSYDPRSHCCLEKVATSDEEASQVSSERQEDGWRVVVR